MTPDFDKIQPGTVNRVPKTERQPKKEVAKAEEKTASISEDCQLDTGVVGRSSVKKPDNFDASLKQVMKNGTVVAAKNYLIDDLVKKGYSLEEATAFICSEFDFL